MKRTICFVLIGCLIISCSTTTFAKSNNNEVKEEKNYKSSITDKKVIVTDSGIIINKKYYTKKEFIKKLQTAKPIKLNNNSNNTPYESSLMAVPAAAGLYFIPGIGEVLITATGAIVIAGVTIAVGTWTYKVIVNYFRDHRKNKRPSNHDKHTKKRPGRSSEKKKQKKGWKNRK